MSTIKAPIKLEPVTIHCLSGSVYTAFLKESTTSLPKSARCYAVELIQRNGIITDEVTIWITYNQKVVKYYATIKDF